MGNTNYQQRNASIFGERNSMYTKANFIFRLFVWVQKVTGNVHALSSDANAEVSRNACKFFISSGT
jgi:hypothetical protein